MVVMVAAARAAGAEAPPEASGEGVARASVWKDKMYWCRSNRWTRSRAEHDHSDKLGGPHTQKRNGVCRYKTQAHTRADMRHERTQKGTRLLLLPQQAGARSGKAAAARPLCGRRGPLRRRCEGRAAAQGECGRGVAAAEGTRRRGPRRQGRLDGREPRRHRCRRQAAAQGRREPRRWPRAQRAA